MPSLWAHSIIRYIKHIQVQTGMCRCRCPRQYFKDYKTTKLYFAALALPLIQSVYIDI